MNENPKIRSTKASLSRSLKRIDIHVNQYRRETPQGDGSNNQTQPVNIEAEFNKIIARFPQHLPWDTWLLPHFTLSC
jgi:hypothetical protein